MAGGAGNDTYFIDSPGDVVIEAQNAGLDNVAAAVSYVLNGGAEVEVLSTTNHGGTANLSLVGNEFGQTIIGNAGANYLVGGGGSDRLQGLSGDDTYIVDADDIVLEAAGGGFDNVAAAVSYVLNAGAEVEVLSTTNHGGTADLSLVGNEFGQTIIGNAGNNVIDGRGGSDLLIGGAGADTFAFTTALGAGNVDTVSGFLSGTDKIALDDAIFGGVTSGNLANAFVVGTAAGDADDRIIYNQATGELFYDADGSGAGAAVLFASLQGAPVLAASDLVVI
jgi:Ca2+-binding RTX toxin-like protein